MKVFLVLLGAVVVGGAGYGIYKAGHVLDLKVAEKQAVQKSADFSQQVNSGLDKAKGLLASGTQLVASGAERLIASGQVLLDQKKQQALEYIKQQKESLKNQAEKAVEAEAKKKVQGIFSGR